MLRHLSAVLLVTSIIVTLGMSGCGQSVTMSMQFSPDQTTKYKSSTEVIKDFRFEQPNLDKLREEQTKTQIEMTYSQAIESVDESGNAVAKITIEGLKATIINKNETRLSFDSSTDTNDPLAKLIGKSYTIQISPTGQAKPLDTKAAAAAVTSSYEKKIVSSLLSPEAIANRHGVSALPKEAASTVSVKSTWTETVPSPPGLLAPKSYEKTYTLTSIDDDVANVTMVAGESAQQTSGQTSSGGMGMFAKMFDNTDDYTGSMKINVATGQVLSAEETLISTYIAQEMPENGDPEKGPDTLTMKFTNRVLLEKLN